MLPRCRARSPGASRRGPGRTPPFGLTHRTGITGSGTGHHGSVPDAQTLGDEMTDQRERWPALPVADWEPTKDTLHMYAQIIGKVALALRPMTNHWWQVALELSARGPRTAAVPHPA